MNEKKDFETTSASLSKPTSDVVDTHITNDSNSVTQYDKNLNNENQV